MNTKTTCLGSGAVLEMSSGELLSAKRRCPHCGRVLKLRRSINGKVTPRLPKHNVL